MKYLILSLLLVGCAGSSSGGGATVSCATSALLGEWNISSPSDSLTFNSDCTGLKDGCNVGYTYSNTTESTGSQAMTVTSYNTSDPGCAGYNPSNGTINFTYSISGNNLTTTFPNGNVAVWTK